MIARTHQIDPLIHEKPASEILGAAVQTLRNWRHVGRGPAYIKLGCSVRYRLSDIEEFINKNRIVRR